MGKRKVRSSSVDYSWGRTGCRLGTKAAMSAAQRRSICVVVLELVAEVPSTPACPAAVEVRNNSKDVSSADGG